MHAVPFPKWTRSLWLAPPILLISGQFGFTLRARVFFKRRIRNPFDNEFEYSIEISEAHPNCRRCGGISSINSPQSALFHSLSFSISRTLFFLSVSIGEEIVRSVQWLNNRFSFSSLSPSTSFETMKCWRWWFDWIVDRSPFIRYCWFVSYGIGDIGRCSTRENCAQNSKKIKKLKKWRVKFVHKRAALRIYTCNAYTHILSNYSCPNNWLPLLCAEHKSLGSYYRKHIFNVQMCTPRSTYISSRTKCIDEFVRCLLCTKLRFSHTKTWQENTIFFVFSWSLSLYLSSICCNNACSPFPTHQTINYFFLKQISTAGNANKSAHNIFFPFSVEKILHWYSTQD